MSSTAKSPDSLYGTDFHADRDARTRASARLVLGKLKEWIDPESACDVGCGVGTWLAAAQEVGIEHVQGFEGPWAKTANLVLAEEQVSFQNLEDKVAMDRRYDLVISLEVAEHLAPNRAAAFVADLCALGDCVLFSAAIPMQGGTGHINEQWQSYWAEHFGAQGFTAFDPLRPMIWADGDIAFWYRQNMLVYAREGSDAAAKLAAQGFGAPAMLDLVHPDQYLHAEAAQPARAISRKVKQVFGRA
ncbi:methyltransferase domain-containing protein [uncultured Erythrobacter sp.]|uniref:methyltransferase domain-containing protein n=1 Tax=uncultured Erythrobacter sp. TaxID=263913 RepID=UPI002624AE1E|nr:methyltransferase domain-containing protein [uncultured Erythrobacter sp.]